jgi:hypothetical protein
MNGRHGSLSKFFHEPHRKGRAIYVDQKEDEPPVHQKLCIFMNLFSDSGLTHMFRKTSLAPWRSTPQPQLSLLTLPLGLSTEQLSPALHTEMLRSFCSEDEVRINRTGFSNAFSLNYSCLLICRHQTA